MSFRKLYWILCNGCLDSIESAGSHTKAEAWVEARSEGWHRTKDGRHLCDFCWNGGLR